MVRVLVGAVVGGVVLFAWSFAGWMFLDVHRLDVEPVLPNEDAVVKALEGTERGVYWIPGGAQDTEPGSDAWKSWEAKHRQGPTGFLVYDPEGSEPMAPAVMAVGLLIQLLVALVVALALRGAAIRSFVGRVLLVLAFGVVVVLVMDAQNWNWQGYPGDWIRGFVIDHLVGFALLGLALAAIVKPARAGA